VGRSQKPGTVLAAPKGVAAGTQEVPSAPLMSRTATVDDPLTTSVLAEVTRRSRTVEVAAEQIDEAMDLEVAELDPDAAGADPPADPAPRPR
jgi:hypothetical protein